MNRTTRGRFQALALMGMLGWALSVSAQGHEKGSGAKPGLRDHVGMFSAGASKQVDTTLGALHDKTHWQAVIETVETLDGKTPIEAATAYAKAQQVHGVYVLIAKKETKVQVVASKTAKATFTNAAEAAIVDAFVKGFRAKDFDRGLLDAVELIRKDAEAKPDQAGGVAVSKSGFPPNHASASGVKPGVRDGAAMFTADAARRVDATLAAVHEKTHWQAVIETVATLDGKTPEDAALANAKALNVHGVYVLIAKKETKVKVEVSKTAKSAFTADAETAIVAAIVKGFRAKDFDRGLLDAAELIRKDAEAKPDPAAVASASSAAPSSAPLASTPHAETADVAKPETRPPAVSPVDLAPAPVAQSEGGGTMLLVVGGLGILFVLWAISRGFRRSQPSEFTKPGAYGPNPNPVQNPNPNPNPAGYGPNPNRGVPPQGYAPAPAAGYGQGGYPPPGYGPAGYGPPPQQGGGGGFIQGALGGLGGAVVGNILYDKFGRPHNPPADPGQGFPHQGGGMLPPTQEVNPAAWPNSPQPSPQPAESYDPNAGAGGDWGSPEPAADPGAGGDWGTPEPEPEPEQGGDWGAPEPQPEPAPEPEPEQGGDWGASDPQPEPDQGGNW